MTELSPQQQEIFQHVVFHHQNAFITGPGGCGKSTLITAILDNLKSCPAINPKHIHVTALTGCAATLLKHSARTLHSWAGLSIHPQTPTQAIDRSKRNKQARNNIKNAHFLIIDEVSMISKSVFDNLNEICKSIRKNPSPFGGIQVLFSGDFYQLPPIPDKRDPDSAKFCFESPNWNLAFPSHSHCFNLTHVFRQTDEEFVKCLHTIRIGTLTPSQYNLLKRKYIKSSTSQPPTNSTYLLSHRRDADQINNENYTNLSSTTTEHVFNVELTIPTKRELQVAKITPKDLEQEKKYLLSKYDAEIKLKEGTRVMYRINSPELGLINGSTGVVTGFAVNTDNIICPQVKFDHKSHGSVLISPHKSESDEIFGLTATQLPLTYAWAITIHKSQGATLNTAIIDIGKCFAEGQVYVALSRVRSLEGIYLIGFNPSAIRANSKVKEFYSSLFTK